MKRSIKPSTEPKPNQYADGVIIAGRIYINLSHTANIQPDQYNQHK